MKIEKLPSGSYRVRKTIDKKTYSFVFDHKPTQAEILDKVITAKQECATGCEMTFEQAAKAYVELKRNVLSPRTIKDYAEMWKRLSKEFYTSKLCEITALDVQKEINLLSADRSAKTVYNYHGFISTILGTYVPELKLIYHFAEKAQE